MDVELERLRARLHEIGSAAVAFSPGADFDDDWWEPGPLVYMDFARL